MLIKGTFHELNPHLWLDFNSLIVVKDHQTFYGPRLIKWNPTFLLPKSMNPHFCQQMNRSQQVTPLAKNRHGGINCLTVASNQTTVTTAGCGPRVERLNGDFFWDFWAKKRCDSSRMAFICIFMINAMVFFESRHFLDDWGIWGIFHHNSW